MLMSKVWDDAVETFCKLRALLGRDAKGKLRPGVSQLSVSETQPRGTAQPKVTALVAFVFSKDSFLSLSYINRTRCFVLKSIVLLVVQFFILISLNILHIF